MGRRVVVAVNQGRQGIFNFKLHSETVFPPASSSGGRSVAHLQCRGGGKGEMGTSQTHQQPQSVPFLARDSVI